MEYLSFPIWYEDIGAASTGTVAELPLRLQLDMAGCITLFQLTVNALEYDEVFRGGKIAGVTGGDLQVVVFGVYERFENGIDC